MSSLVEQHDELLRIMPPEAVHEKTTCIVCTAKLDNPEGGVMTTYSEEQFLAAIEPIQRELETLRASQAEEAIAARLAEAKTAAEADADERVSQVETDAAQKLTDIQSKLDAAEVQANANEDKYNKLVTYLTEQAEAATAAALAETRREDRKTAIAGLGILTEEQVDARVELWLDKDDEAFVAYLEDLTALAAAAKASADPAATTTTLTPGTPVATAIDGTRQAATTVTDDRPDTFAALANLARAGVDIRNLSL